MSGRSAARPVSHRSLQDEPAPQPNAYNEPAKLLKSVVWLCDSYGNTPVPPDPDASSAHRDAECQRGAWMGVFVVTMQHPVGTGNDVHFDRHAKYMSKIMDEGKLIAAGPLTCRQSSLLIILTDSKTEAEVIVADDPLSAQNLISALTIVEWDPVFGALQDLSSRKGR